MKDVDWFEINVPEQEGIYRLNVNGKSYCMVVKHDKIFVLSNRCPHAGADLSQGWCEGEKLVCPFHRHKFDLSTGKGDSGQGNFVHSYPTKKENNKWYVGLPKSWWKRLFVL